MLPTLKTAVLFLALFLAIDLLFLGVLAKRFYRQNIGPLLLDKFNAGAAIVFYLCYTLGVAYFVLLPASTNATPLLTAAVNGAMLGFTAYATYNFTNMATLKGWSQRLSIVDVTWGTIATSFASTLAMVLTTN